MKLRDIFREKNRRSIKTDLRVAKRRNNPKYSDRDELDDMNMSYDGEGDMSGNALTNFQAGGK